MMNFLKSRTGISLIEVLIVIGITAILGTVATVNFLGFRSAYDLDIAAKTLADYLRFARQSAVSQNQGSAWGAHLAASATGDSYVIFSGPSFAAGTAVATVALPRNVRFTDPAEGSVRDIIFAKVTGRPSAGAASATLALEGGSSVKTISVSPVGLISAN